MHEHAIPAGSICVTCPKCTERIVIDEPVQIQITDDGVEASFLRARIAELEWMRDMKNLMLIWRLRQLAAAHPEMAPLLIEAANVIAEPDAERCKACLQADARAATAERRLAAVRGALEDIANTFQDDDETPQDFGKRIRHIARAALAEDAKEGGQ